MFIMTGLSLTSHATATTAPFPSTGTRAPHNPCNCSRTSTTSTSSSWSTSWRPVTAKKSPRCSTPPWSITTSTAPLTRSSQATSNSSNRSWSQSQVRTLRSQRRRNSSIRFSRCSIRWWVRWWPGRISSKARIRSIMRSCSIPCSSRFGKLRWSMGSGLSTCSSAIRCCGNRRTSSFSTTSGGNRLMRFSSRFHWQQLCRSCRLITTRRFTARRNCSSRRSWSWMRFMCCMFRGCSSCWRSTHRRTWTTRTSCRNSWFWVCTLSSRQPYTHTSPKKPTSTSTTAASCFSAVSTWTPATLPPWATATWPPPRNA